MPPLTLRVCRGGCFAGPAARQAQPWSPAVVEPAGSREGQHTGQRGEVRPGQMSGALHSGCWAGRQAGSSCHVAGSHIAQASTAPGSAAPSTAAAANQRAAASSQHSPHCSTPSRPAAPAGLCVSLVTNVPIPGLSGLCMGVWVCVWVPCGSAACDSRSAGSIQIQDASPAGGSSCCSREPACTAGSLRGLRGLRGAQTHASAGGTAQRYSSTAVHATNSAICLLSRAQQSISDSPG